MCVLISQLKGGKDPTFDLFGYWDLSPLIVLGRDPGKVSTLKVTSSHMPYQIIDVIELVHRRSQRI